MTTRRGAAAIETLRLKLGSILPIKGKEWALRRGALILAGG
jgi:hypothetical protein